MKTSICLFYFLLSITVFSQVGINTTNPTKMLDVDGEVRVRNIPEMMKDSILVSDGKGNVGHRNIASITTQGITFDYDKKYAVRTSTPNGNSIYNRYTNTSGLYITTGSTTHPFVELNLSIDVNIPINTKAIVTVDYIVPMGVVGQHTQVNGYLGTTFFKNGLRKPEADRKFSLNQMFKINNQSNHSHANMNYATAQYVEIVINDTQSIITNTFEVKGYIEQAYANDDTLYRFNNWESWYNMNHTNFPNLNRNWGVGYIAYTVIYIPL